MFFLQVRVVTPVKIKKNFHRSWHAERAGVLDAVLSSGARSAPELGPASGFRGLNSDHLQIRKFQPLNLDLGYLRKLLQPLTSWGNFPRLQGSLG